MTYVTINEKTTAGKRILEELCKNRNAGQVLEEPNAETRKAMKSASNGEGVRIQDIDKWFQKQTAKK